LTCLGITFVAQRAGGQARFGVRISSDLGLIFPWNSHIRDSHRCQEEVCAGFLPRFARLRSQQAFEHGQMNTSTCSTRSARQSTPAPDLACPASRQRPADAMARARAYKTTSDLNRTPPHALNLTGAHTHRRLPVHGVSAATRAPATVDRPTKPFPTPSSPRRRLRTPR
jgi:hypothetical protein